MFPGTAQEETQVTVDLYVKTEDLASLIEKQIFLHESERPRLKDGTQLRKNAENAQHHISGLEWVAHSTGLNLRKLYTIRNRQSKMTTFEVADKLVSGLGLNFLWADGTLKLRDKEGGEVKNEYILLGSLAALESSQGCNTNHNGCIRGEREEDLGEGS